MDSRQRTPEELVAHLARLARVGLTPEEAKSYGKEFRDIVSFVGAVERLPGPKAEAPTATISGVRQVIRADRVEPSHLAAELLQQAPHVEKGAVAVPAVL